MAVLQERDDGVAPAGSDAAGGGKQYSGTAKTNLWSSLLDGVASAKQLPEKNLLVLGSFVRLSQDAKVEESWLILQ